MEDGGGVMRIDEEEINLSVPVVLDQSGMPTDEEIFGPGPQQMTEEISGVFQLEYRFADACGGCNHGNCRVMTCPSCGIEYLGDDYGDDFCCPLCVKCYLENDGEYCRLCNGCDDTDLERLCGDCQYWSMGWCGHYDCCCKSTHKGATSCPFYKKREK
jgi:hypothetical protein